MKKLLTILVAFIFVINLSACDRTEFERAVTKYAEAKSLTIYKVEVNQSYGDLVTSFYFDGDLTKIEYFGETIYFEQDDDMYYAYILDDETQEWEKVEVTSGNTDPVMPPIEDFLEEDFYYQEGWYVALNEYETENGLFTDMGLRIDDNEITNISFTYIEDYTIYLFDVTLVDYNKTDVKLP